VVGPLRDILREREDCDQGEEQRLGFRPELLPNSVDTDVFVADRPPFFDLSAVTVVLHPARLLPWKGVHVTIRAIEQLRKSRFP
jgi:glycosyltransferase involved in cell wall biosynthesis